MRGVQKRFGGSIALAGVDLEVVRGEVHALVGENGAGKSTLMKVLAGAHRPDEGVIELDGEPFAPASPAQALRAGIAMIYQELSLAPHLSIEDNLMLGREQSRGGILRRGAMRASVRATLAQLGHGELDPRRKVAALGPGARQMVEVARALMSDARIVVMDEPTSSLSQADTERLFAVMQRLKQRGVSVIYISHFLDEVTRVADRYTVLRDGATVATGTIAAVTIDQLIEKMVGRRVADLFPHVPHSVGEVIVAIDALQGVRLPRCASFELRRGEILGVAGLVGAGRTEMLRALFGLDLVRAGTITIASVRSCASTPHQRLREGVGMLSEDRKHEGLALNRSIAENITLSRLEPFLELGWLRKQLRNAATARWIERLAIRSTGPAQRVRDLSGGNQQKVALARLLHHDVDVLLLDEPTRGVDVGSKAEIYRLIGQLAAQGKAILFVSSYIPELLGVCDRVAVMHRGTLGRGRAVGEWTQESIMAQATRGAE
ncbi:MAG: sugar ABC transporter ATP-binding protein [Planctomycetota bacterium]